MSSIPGFKHESMILKFYDNKRLFITWGIKGDLLIIITANLPGLHFQIEHWMSGPCQCIACHINKLNTEHVITNSSQQQSIWRLISHCDKSRMTGWMGSGYGCTCMNPEWWWLDDRQSWEQYCCCVPVYAFCSYKAWPITCGRHTLRNKSLTLSVLSLLWSIVYIAGKGLMRYIHVQTMVKGSYSLEWPLFRNPP